MNKQEIENYWLNLLSEHDSDVNIVEGIEWEIDDNILSDTKCVLSDGYGFVLGSLNDKLVICELEYPEISNLRSTDFYLISRHLGFDVDKNTITEEDVASYYGTLDILAIED